ncbi:hypothetical protein ACFL2M_00870 [Patescibacteria group bacterium]
MENYILGIQAIGRGLSALVRGVAQLDLFWGFALGFFVSVLVHGFIVSEKPTELPKILMNRPAKSFQRIYDKDKKGQYMEAYSTYRKTAMRVKFLFGLAAALFFLIVFAALIRY